MEDFSFDQIKFVIDGLEKIKIYPFSWRNGVVNLTEKGYVESSASSSNYAFMQKYFTGKDVLTITWDDSTKITVWDPLKGQFKYNFKVGKYYEAVELPPASNSLDIGKNDAHEDFINMVSNYEVSFAVYNWTPTEDDLFKPYIILTETERKVLFLTNYLITRNPNNKSETITTLTFISSKDKLITSGRAIEQFIQFAAPGEPYAFPEEQSDGTVKLSQTIGQNPEGIKYIQIEHQGAAGYCGTLITGRKVWRDPTTGFWISSPSSFLMPFRLVNTQTNPLNKTGAPAKTYYFFNDETVETRTDIDFQDANTKLDSALAPLKNEGVFTMGLAGEWTNGIHASNELEDGIYTTFLDLDWRPNKKNITRDSSGCLYTTDENVITTNDNLIQILIKNMFLYSTQLELPLDFTDSKPYRWSTIPLFGNLIRRFYGDKAMFSTTIKKKTISLAYFINTSIAQLNTKYFTQPNEQTARWYGTLATFLGEGSPKGLPAQGTTTCFAYELTDKIRFKDAENNLAQVETSTVNFGQEKDENGNWFHDDHTPLHLNVGADGNIEPIRNPFESFVIDQIENFALFNGKIKISCFGEYTNSNMTNPIFTQTVLSSSKFESENVRNWCTEINSGSWSAEYVEGNLIWPITPYKETSTREIIINKYGKDFRFGPSGQTAGPYPVYRDDRPEQLVFNYIRNYRKSDTEVATGVTIDDVIHEQELPLSDIVQVENPRAWILNNIDHFSLDVSGSTLKNEQGGPYIPTATYIADINSGSITIPISQFVYNEETDEYIFDKKIAAGAFNCTLDNPLLNVVTFRGEEAFSYWRIGEEEEKSNTYQGGFSQTIGIKLVLAQDYMQILIHDNSILYGYNDYLDSHNAKNVNFGPDPLPYYREQKSIITSRIKVNSLLVIEK